MTPNRSDDWLADQPSQFREQASETHLSTFLCSRFPYHRNSVFDHFRKWCYTEKRNSAQPHFR